MLRVYVGILAFVAIAFILWAGGSLIMQAFRNPKRQAAKALKQDKARRKGIVNSATMVDANVQNYLNVVSAHGPDSEEAQAFRLGMGTSFAKELQGDKVAVEAFLQDANIIDETYRKTRKNVRGKDPIAFNKKKINYDDQDPYG